MIPLYVFVCLTKCVEPFGHYVQDPYYDDISFVVQFIELSNTDSKMFVDRYLTKDFSEVKREFFNLLNENNINVDKLKYNFLIRDEDPKDKVTDKFKEEVKKFYLENFEEDGTSFKEAGVRLEKHPLWFDELSNDLQNIATKIFNLWSVYGKISNDENENRTTKIHIDGIFFVPGGRFKELYYWDSYWILIGLLESGMDEYALDLVKCFVFLINKLGYIPNGTRAYYVGRTQPPVFCQMLYKLYKHTRREDIKEYILSKGLEAAEVEYKFFMTYRRVRDARYKNEILNQYYANVSKPRYESYKEDLKILKERYAKGENVVYSNLWTGAESGWDFSTRWFDGDELADIDIINIIPVDLNAFMLENERILGELNSKILKNNSSNEVFSKIQTYKDNRKRRWFAMRKMLFNKKIKCWNDFNFRTNKLNDSRFYFSNIMPLFYMDGLEEQEGEIIRNVLDYYKETLFGHKGGVPCSGKPPKRDKNPQQWDFPNVWAPHVQMFTEFLIKYGYVEMAYHVGRSFLNSVKAVKKDNEIIFMEKYNCDEIGIKGEGGEYNVQEGFGWTNGTVTYLLKTFGNRLEEEFDHEKSYEEISEMLSQEENQQPTFDENEPTFDEIDQPPLPFVENGLDKKVLVENK